MAVKKDYVRNDQDSLFFLKQLGMVVYAYNRAVGKQVDLSEFYSSLVT